MELKGLQDLRDRIRQVDRQLVTLAAERVDLARQVGEIKRREGLPTIDYAQERTVLERVRAAAVESGLDPGFAEEIFVRLIRASVLAQDEDNLRRSAQGTGMTAVVVGGAGRMGRWMRRFLAAQGCVTGSLDPASSPEENTWAEKAVTTADLVILSTPPASTAQRYQEWFQHPPRGVLADIASIKSPLIEPIRELQRRGARVASIHPMFGPSATLLRDADIVVCDTGDPGATALMEGLFQPTTARLVRLPLEDHDRVMADLLSLAHAASIAFALALPESGHPVRSTTFQALHSLSSSVVRESPEVYYEIQALNPHSRPALDRLRVSLEKLAAAASAPDSTEFERLFEEGARKASAGSSGC